MQCPSVRSRLSVVAGAQASPEPRRQAPGSASGRLVAGKPPALYLPSGPHIVSNSAGTNGVSCSSSAFAEASVNIQERNEFRRGVGLCVVNRDGLVFAAKRMDDHLNTWQMPQGGIDPYENPLVAAMRELHEETGMTSVRIVSSIDRWLEYEWATKVRCHLTGQWIRYRGQTQKWHLLHFHGSDEEIDITCHGSPEFSEWRWMRLEELPHSVVDFKRGVYQAVAGHFGPHVQRLAKSQLN